MLQSIGPKVSYIGAGGTAAQMKVAINLCLIVEMVAFCEAVALAEKGGVQREMAVEAMLQSVVASPVMGYRGPFILEGGMPEKPLASVLLQQKDMLLALDLGRRQGRLSRWRRLPTRCSTPATASDWTSGTSSPSSTCTGRWRGCRDGQLPHQPPPGTRGRRSHRSRRMGGHAGAVPHRQGVGRIRRTAAGMDGRPPGARHERHRHPNADEFFVVLTGAGRVYTDDGLQPAAEGDVIFTERGHWHGFDNTGDEDVTLVWGWSGAGSLEDAGYEVALS